MNKISHKAPDYPEIRFEPADHAVIIMSICKYFVLALLLIASVTIVISLIGSCDVDSSPPAQEPSEIAKYEGPLVDVTLDPSIKNHMLLVQVNPEDREVIIRITIESPLTLAPLTPSK